MPSNVEIKARVADAAAFAECAIRLCGTPGQQLDQHDSFYAVPAGRLKLRRFGDGSAELIFYHRADSGGPKLSQYSRLPVQDANGTHAMLQQALGSIGDVKKRRQLWLSGRTRIHLDIVEGLGAFMELEVVMREDEEPAVGVAEADALMRQLGIGHQELVSGAYLDLLQAAKAS